MRTVGEILALAVPFLSEKGVARPRRTVEELLAATLGLKRLELYMQFERPIEEKELAAFKEKLKRGAAHEPIAYILGEVEFLGCSIRSDRRALIPRPETEILVAGSLSRIKGPRVWDVCCGTGCIGIAIKKKRPELQVCLSDLSEEALSLARENGQRNGVELEWRQGDLLAPFRGEKADAIFCNPPYVFEEEYPFLDPSVRLFEPRIALVGGVSFYERLSQEAPHCLRPGGQLFLEIGAQQGEKVQEIFRGGPWKEKRLEKDWSGHDRFFFLEMQ
jgi:release factor glutamine methyltransferase